MADRRPAFSRICNSAARTSYLEYLFSTAKVRRKICYIVNKNTDCFTKTTETGKKCTTLQRKLGGYADPPLQRRMSTYTYFSYNTNEALLMSEQQRQTIVNLLDALRKATGKATGRRRYVGNGRRYVGNGECSTTRR